MRVRPMGKQGSAKRVRFAVAVISLQLLAAVFFFADSFIDADEQTASGLWEALSWLEVGVALALLAGIVTGAVFVRRLMREAKRREQALRRASGALAEVMPERFANWNLSPSEADVALFALKGCSVADIASMRSAAPGTVRAQLSQVYAKAGVTSQASLMALFLDDLLAIEPEQR